MASEHSSSTGGSVGVPRRRASVPDRTGPTAREVTPFREDAAVAMRIYLALGDSISIDDYTGVPAVNRGLAKLARERGFLVADLERLFHGHGVASNEPWFVQVIEPNLAGATAIAEHWYELLQEAAARAGGDRPPARARSPALPGGALTATRRAACPRRGR
jgi:hypothetical protein